MSPAIVRVALPVPLPQCFDYTAQSIAPGDLGRCVRVPFGRGEKTGLIVALPDAADLPVERLKPVIAIQREAPALPADWQPTPLASGISRIVTFLRSGLT